jgi:DNA polymerase III alpha subunit
MQVKGAREDEVHALLEERESNGPFLDLDDLLRVNLSIPIVESLTYGGVFVRWAPDGDRTRLLWVRLGGVPHSVLSRPRTLSTGLRWKWARWG